jgi:pSer/pThr/pTyr-binding forkhead associated (FHA) protein
MATVGRDESCDIVLRFPQVSARHAQIEFVGPGRFSIRDLGSTNGTFVNGRRITEASVGLSDEVRLGSVHLDMTRVATTLEVESHGQRGLIVGRDPGCDICIPDGRVSGRHASVTLGPNGISIVDLGSSNGTFLNGTQVTRALVRPGDRVRFGSMEVDLFGLVGRGSIPQAARSPQFAPQNRPQFPGPVHGVGQRVSGPVAEPATSRRGRSSLMLVGIIVLAVILVGAGVVFGTSHKVVKNCELCGAVALRERSYLWNRSAIAAKNESTHWCDACGSQPVTVHHILRCKHCSKVYQDLSETRPRREQPQASDEVKGYCTPCGDEPVAVNYPVKCSQCGRVYTHRTEYFPRRMEKQPEEQTEGYCSFGCNAGHTIERGAEIGRDILDRLMGQ